MRMREKETVVLIEVFWSVGFSEETANLRQSSNANRSPIHPRLAPLKSRGAGGLLFEGDFF